jgi:hypothetical protein
MSPIYEDDQIHHDGILFCEKCLHPEMLGPCDFFQNKESVIFRRQKEHELAVNGNRMEDGDW